jgi:ankyrin repeat protein
MSEQSDPAQEADFYNIIVAAEDGYFEKVRDILETSYPPTVTNVDRCEMTPLHFASEKGHLEVIELLVKNGALIDARNIWDKTPLHSASNNGHLAVVQYLVEHGARIEAVSNKKRFTPLHLASQYDHLDVVKYLVEEGADVTVQAEDGKTAYDLAISEDVRVVLHTAAHRYVFVKNTSP